MESEEFTGNHSHIEFLSIYLTLMFLSLRAVYIATSNLRTTYSSKGKPYPTIMAGSSILWCW